MKSFYRIAPVWEAIGTFIALLIQGNISLAADTTTVRRIHQAPSINDVASAMQAGNSTAPVFQTMTRIDRFKQYVPRDGEDASERTIVYIGYDETHFHAAFLCFDKEPELIRANLVNRDNVPSDNETVALHLDPFRDGKRMYGFQCNARGVQIDGFYTEGTGWDLSFNAIWQCEARLTQQGYAVLISVPFKSLRYSAEEIQTWGIFFFRGITRRSESSFFPHRTLKIQSRVQQEGILQGLERLPTGQNIQIIPYAAARSAQYLDAQHKDAAGQPKPDFTTIPFEASAGVDVKTVLGGNLVLDATLNPDFSQVESDQPQITTNQRFELFFPERRPFFLENASFFDTPINTVFSRRIANPQIGARITGKVGEYSIGALVADDRAPALRNSALNGARAWSGALRVNRDLVLNTGTGAAGVGASSIGAVYTGRLLANSFNHVGGFDTRLQVSDNWVFMAQALGSYSRGLTTPETTLGAAFTAQASYSDANWTYNGAYNDRSPNYRTDLGFVPRTDVRNVSNVLNYRLRPADSPVSDWGGDVQTNHIADYGGTLLEATYTARAVCNLVAQTSFSLDYTRSFEALRPQDSYAIQTTTGFWQENIGVFVWSSIVKQANFSVVYNAGSRINYTPAEGKPLELCFGQDINATLNLRLFPELTIDNSYLYIGLRNRANNECIIENHIFRSRWNYQATRELSFRAILQYTATNADLRYSLLESRKNLNADILLTYLVNPGTALHLGYNNNFQNYDPTLTWTGEGLLRSEQGYVRDSWQVFVKVQYLLGL
ncbi:MAG: carbohydrate binding family 9 domain-containing protein [Candidatus Kapabacteria bacterium]|nr:carbohydrate binding family 9 domain-containing protein [Candidatus Kapabacteria bacterium]